MANPSQASEKATITLSELAPANAAESTDLEAQSFNRESIRDFSFSVGGKSYSLDINSIVPNQPAGKEPAVSVSSQPAAQLQQVLVSLAHGRSLAWPYGEGDSSPNTVAKDIRVIPNGSFLVPTSMVDFQSNGTAIARENTNVTLPEGGKIIYTNPTCPGVTYFGMDCPAVFEKAPRRNISRNSLRCVHWLY